jgi:DNA polymerase
MFVETAPGAEEDLEGEPLVGRWKRLLDKLLTDAQIDPITVYRTYLVKCWPNRTKLQAEHIHECKVWLWRELQTIQPRVVVTFGKTPTATLFRESTMKLSDVSGKLYKVNYMKSLVAPWYSLDVVLKGSQARHKETISFFSQVRQRIA